MITQHLVRLSPTNEEVNYYKANYGGLLRENINDWLAKTFCYKVGKKLNGYLYNFLCSCGERNYGVLLELLH